MQITVKVPAARDRAAVASLEGREEPACATASAEAAKRQGNASRESRRPGGHPPLGVYTLLGAAPVPADAEGEYGSRMLVFEPVGGEALQAEAFGRLLLPAYAGPAGVDGKLRPTQGGLRLPEAFVGYLASLAGREDVTLVLKPLEPAWWQFWMRAPSTSRLSKDGPRDLAAPLDEASLVMELARGMARRPRRSSLDRDDRDDDRDRSSRNSDSGTSVSGGGGQSGGGGASSGWDAGPSASPPGANASGQIVAAAAGAAAGVALASAMSSAEAAEDRQEAAGDSGDSADSSGSSGGDSSSSDSGTSTSTSY